MKLRINLSPYYRKQSVTTILRPDDQFTPRNRFMAKKKLRLDVLVKEKGLAQSRSRAQALIMAGSVLVDGKPVTKAGYQVTREQKILVKADRCPFVSRGGLKLNKALNHFRICVKSRICLDAGASTGGFTHCLLKHGARLVYAIDVGYGQLDWSLRTRPEVINMEKTNIRHVSSGSLDPVPDLAVIDTSFISLRIVVPAVLQLIKPRAEIIALVKPQFEAGREKVGKGGIIKDPEVHAEVLTDLELFFARHPGLQVQGIIASPVLGAKGNREFLMYMQRDIDRIT